MTAPTPSHHPTMSQVAGMNVHYQDYPLVRFLDAMVEHGLEQVDLWGGSPHVYPDDMTPGDVRAIRDESRARGLRVVCYTPEQVMYPVNIAAAGLATRTRSVGYLLRSLDIALELGAPRMLVTAGRGDRSEPPEDGWRRSRDSLRMVADAATERGIRLSLEVLQPTESNLVTDLRSTARMLSDVGDHAVDACVDTVPMVLAGESLDEWFDTLGGRLAQVHLVDGTPTGHLAWGDGTLPLPAFLDAISRWGFAGPLTLELAASRYLPDPDRATRQAVTTLRAAMAGLDAPAEAS